MQIVQDHGLGKEGARRAAEALADELAPVMTRWGVRLHWEGDSALLTGSGPSRGASGRIELGEADVAVHVKLPMLLQWIEPKVTAIVEERLAKELR